MFLQNTDKIGDCGVLKTLIKLPIDTKANIVSPDVDSLFERVLASFHLAHDCKLLVRQNILDEAQASLSLEVLFPLDVFRIPPVVLLPLASQLIFKFQFLFY